MYLCHSEILMPKDTKSLGNNKAPACESRGFVRKKQKVCILTHLLGREDGFGCCHCRFGSLRRCRFCSRVPHELFVRQMTAFCLVGY